MIAAGEVIVCCGATRTPPLLQRSGFADVGDGLQDHLGVAAVYQHPGPSRLGGSPAQVLWDGGDVHLIPTVVADDGTTTTVTVLAFLLDLDDRGSVDGDVVRAQQRGPTGRRPAGRRWSTAWPSGRRPTPSAGCTSPASATCPTRPPPASSATATRPRRAPWARTSTTECRLLAADGVRVVDASSLPVLVAAPPYLTCVVLAERVAELMRAG